MAEGYEVFRNVSINQSNNLYSAKCLSENRRRYREKLTNYVTVWSNKWVFSLPRKTPEEVKLRRSKGKEFQILGAATSRIYQKCESECEVW